MRAISPRRPPVARRRSVAGFTLIEVLMAMVLMTIILSALALVTSQWLPNWNRGMVRVQSGERLALGLQRIAADLAAAEMVTPNGSVKTLLFDGSQLAVTFVRTAIGPNATPGLDIVRLSEKSDALGLALVRERARFVPMPPDAQLRFSDLVVLIRAPFRVTFAYGGDGQGWQPTWREAKRLPRVVRMTVRDAASHQVLAASGAALVHVNTPAECVGAQSVDQCLAQLESKDQGTRPAAGPEL